VYQKLEDIIYIYLELKKANLLDKEVLPFDFLGSPGRSISRTFSILFKLPNPLDYIRS
jgi:hypothetical protein